MVEICKNRVIVQPRTGRPYVTIRTDVTGKGHVYER